MIHTPENAEIRLPLAGMFSRATAFVHDLASLFVILLVEGIVYVMLLSNSHSATALAADRALLYGVFIIFVFLTVIGYFPFYEIFRNGQTPGKKAYGLRVVTLTGQKISFFSSLLRNFLRIADFLPFLFLAGVFSTLITDRHQRIGDLLAGTVVIRTEE